MNMCLVLVLERYDSQIFKGVLSFTQNLISLQNYRFE